jgi:spore coat protein H
MRSLSKGLLAAGLGTLLLLGCRETDPAHPDGWSYDTHGNDARANYQTVFPDDGVLKLDIKVAAADWQAMMGDLTDMLGPFGAGANQPPPPPGGGPGGPIGPISGGPIPFPPEAYEACSASVAGDPCSFTFGGDDEVSGTCNANPEDSRLVCLTENVIGGDLLTRTPLWRPVRVTFNGRPWHHVGMRFKGNSTLTNSWNLGNGKLPFRLSFDHFEDEHIDVRNQRFYGFKQLSFGNNDADLTFVREKVVSDLLRQGGIAAPRATYARVYLDKGGGPEYLGLYAMSEIPDKPMMEAELGGWGGNLYKPEGKADWRAFDQASFEKDSNEAEQDWTDVQNAIAALNSNRDDAVAWRSRLETWFDVDNFLRWLSANAVLANWDTYGAIAHNYYLYGVPRDGGRLRWIPWDHDLALGSEEFPLFYESSADDRWPLLKFLLEDPVYRSRYTQYLRTFTTNVFRLADVQRRLTSEYARVAPFVAGPNGERAGFTSLRSPEDFQLAQERLNAIVIGRSQRAAEALAGAGP